MLNKHASLSKNHASSCLCTYQRWCTHHSSEAVWSTCRHLLFIGRCNQPIFCYDENNWVTWWRIGCRWYLDQCLPLTSNLKKQQAGCIENNIPSSQQINLKNWKKQKQQKNFGISNIDHRTECSVNLLNTHICIYIYIFLSLKELQTSSLMLQGRHELILQIHGSWIWKNTPCSSPRRKVTKLETHETHMNDHMDIKCVWYV